MSYQDRGLRHDAGIGEAGEASHTQPSPAHHDEGTDSKVTELHTAWDVDRHIVLDSADKVVLVRFSSYCLPPDEIVFYGLRGASSGEDATQKREGGEEEKRRKHRSSSRSSKRKRKEGEEEGAPVQGEANDDDDDLLDTLDSIENRKRRKSTTDGDTAPRHHPHKHHRSHGHSSSSTSFRPPDASHVGGTTSEDVSGMEHYLATQRMDAMLVEMAPKVRKFCKIFTVDTSKVTEFNALYELGHNRDPFALMFFYRNTHIKMDVGTGNNNKINFFAFEDWSELLTMVEAAYRAGKLGKHMTSIDRKYSTVSLKR